MNEIQETGNYGNPGVQRNCPTSRYFVNWSRATRTPARMKNGALPSIFELAISNSHVVFNLPGFDTAQLSLEALDSALAGSLPLALRCPEPPRNLAFQA